ncbi:hypothetical protein CLV59_101699 [Chitinophaga dinghuensis]|uniref:Uncharacterized protein n=1 Tax=Chitinophaga dinghuensis TaxID=1539050 RepID=A0A327WJH4_9BACT|nr:hypothetical protein CLV59_101699 [Chitinophaga dinghuensis]
MFFDANDGGGAPAALDFFSRRAAKQQSSKGICCIAAEGDLAKCAKKQRHMLCCFVKPAKAFQGTIPQIF